MFNPYPGYITPKQTISLCLHRRGFKAELTAFLQKSSRASVRDFGCPETSKLLQPWWFLDFSSMQAPAPPPQHTHTSTPPWQLSCEGRFCCHRMSIVICFFFTSDFTKEVKPMSLPISTQRKAFLLKYQGYRPPPEPFQNWWVSEDPWKGLDPGKWQYPTASEIPSNDH